MQGVGRWILGSVATITATAGYLVDWNSTHLQNPDWPPHAKFHDAWTILLGTALGGSALYSLRKGDLTMAALLPALFWATQAGSFAFPNTAGADAEFPELVPMIGGLRLNEGLASALMLTLTAAGYYLARGQSSSASQPHPRGVTNRLRS